MIAPVVGWGRLAQLGEHMPYKHGVTSSILVPPTRTCHRVGGGVAIICEEMAVFVRGGGCGFVDMIF